MIGKNPLWVAKQHGHSIATMLRVYAAWAEGSVESDLEAIRRSMDHGATHGNVTVAAQNSGAADVMALPLGVIRQYNQPRRAPERWQGTSDLAANLAAEQPATN